MRLFNFKNLSSITAILVLLLSCRGPSPEGDKTPPKEAEEVENQEETKDQKSESLVWHFEDDFTAAEQSRLQKWIHKVFSATEQVLGKYPFPVHIYFHDAGSSNEPVPWAHTRRAPHQEAHFHVDLDFNNEEFMNDWTAPHELSHLSIPFLGRENAWFAEGYASYWQYQIMHELGVLSKKEMEKEYELQWVKNLGYISHDENYIEIVKAQRKKHNYPAMYWGGAYYFYVYAQALTDQGTSFSEVMHAFLKCCRFGPKTYDGIVQQWDELSGLDFGSETLEYFESHTGAEVLEQYPYQ